MSIATETLKVLLINGGRIEIIKKKEKGYTAAGEARFTVANGKFKFIATLARLIGTFSSDEGILSRVPKNWAKGSQILYEFDFNEVMNFGPNRYQVGGCDTIRIQTEEEVIFIHPNGPDPMSVEFQEKERERNATHPPATAK